MAKNRLQKRISAASFAAEEPKWTAGKREICYGLEMVVRSRCNLEYSIAQHEGLSCAAPPSIDRADVLAELVRCLTKHGSMVRKDNDADWEWVEGRVMEGPMGAGLWLVRSGFLEAVIWLLEHPDDTLPRSWSGGV